MLQSLKRHRRWIISSKALTRLSLGWSSLVLSLISRCFVEVFERENKNRLPAVAPGPWTMIGRMTGLLLFRLRRDFRVSQHLLSWPLWSFVCVPWYVETCVVLLLSCVLFWVIFMFFVCVSLYSVRKDVIASSISSQFSL